MKYTITLTAEDLEFLERSCSEDEHSIVLCSIRAKLNGWDAHIDITSPQSIREAWAKLEPLFKPVKGNYKGTAEICNLCAASYRTSSKGIHDN